METIDLFQIETTTARGVQPISFISESPVDRASRLICDLFNKRHICVIAFSSGKDSSALACLFLAAAAQYRREDKHPPPIIVTHSSTGVENPVIVDLAASELRKMESFAALHDFDLQVLTGEPDLSSSFVGRVLTGRALPTYASSRTSDCSISWKVLVGERLLKEALAMHKKYADWERPVVMTGVRAQESVARDLRIAARKEHDAGIWTNDEGDLRASPILSFSTDDVWETLGLAAVGVLESYSDFSDVIDFYRDANGGGCVIVADMRPTGPTKPCGARSGCWACARAGRSDRSAEQLVESNRAKYGHLIPLNRLRNWLVNTQYDWSLRNYLGRTISDDGYIEVGADSFSPETLRKLLIYSLTAERRSGVKIISLAQLIFVDAKWSERALAPPFTALKTYFDVVDGGQWEEAPEVPFHPPTPAPKVGRIHVGPNWYEATGLRSMAGLRDPMMELHHESCGVSLKTLRNGAIVCDYEVGRKYEVDEEGAADFIAFLAEDYIRDLCHHQTPDWTEGFRIYQRLGILTIGAGQSRTVDETLRRSQWVQKMDLHGQRSVEQLKARCTDLYEQQSSLF